MLCGSGDNDSFVVPVLTGKTMHILLSPETLSTRVTLNFYCPHFSFLFTAAQAGISVSNRPIPVASDSGQQQQQQRGYEPPLMNVFIIQWFLTLFATCLSREAVLRIWDSIMLEGSEVILRTAVVIMEFLSRFVGKFKMFPVSVVCICELIHICVRVCMYVCMYVYVCM